MLVCFLPAVAPELMDMQEEEGQEQEATPTLEQTGEGVEEGSSKDTMGGDSGGVSGSSVASAGVSGDTEEKTVQQSEEEVKLWSAVRGNPSDFTSWTSLLQIVEQKVGEGERTPAMRQTAPSVWRIRHACLVHVLAISLLSCLPCPPSFSPSLPPSSPSIALFLPLPRVLLVQLVRCSMPSSSSTRTAMGIGRSTQTWRRDTATRELGRCEGGTQGVCS